MSGVSDKARFYLEQAVPQLREFEEKKIFTKDEIRTLVKKRSNFEHKILARGSSPLDFVQYAAWEINLENLRQKRCKRLKIKGSSAHAGQARIFLIFDRGTRKHPSDVKLWTSYLEFTREVKAIKKFKIIMTAALRMHPTKSQLWLYAAKWTLEIEADMSAARSYMQRGIRFCDRSPELWIEYAKLEMIYLAKINLRRRILGLNGEKNQATLQDSDIAVFDVKPTSQDEAEVEDASSHALESTTLDMVTVDADAVKDPLTTPALNGAIPLAIYDDARTHSFWSDAVAEDFFNMVSAFPSVPSQPKLLEHILETMTESFPKMASTFSCYIRRPIIGIDPATAAFPLAFASSLDRLKKTREQGKVDEQLSTRIAAWLEPILNTKGLDEDIYTVLRYTLRKLRQ